MSDAQENVNNPCGAFLLCMVQCLLGYIQALLVLAVILYLRRYAHEVIASHDS